MAKEIQLNKGLVTIVDDDDYEFLSQFTWCAHIANKKCYHAVTNFRKDPKGLISQVMHRHIMGNPINNVYHKNGNTLDNRKENLLIGGTNNSWGYRNLKKKLI